jgi:RimJ/RimL family protein N-acetyltransferase
MDVDIGRGQTLTVREAVDDDVALIGQLYRDLSIEDRHRRFFSVVKVTDGFVRRWLDRCRDGGCDLVAVVDDRSGAKRLVAEAGYVRLPDGNGELAITVARDRRGWLGPFLLDLLIDEAAARGIANLEADVLTENTGMMALARKRRYVTDGDPDFSVVHLVIGTTPDGPEWGAPRGRRLLVERPGGRWAMRRDAVRAGFTVMACGYQGDRCPALRGDPCPLAGQADVIVVAFPRGDARGEALVEAHEQLHGSVPVVVEVPSRELDGRATCRLVSGRPSPELRHALDEALALDDGRTPSARSL